MLPTTTKKNTTVHTTLPTLPLPPNPSRAPILTPRLLLRSLLPTDLPALHALHRQPEVTQWTSQGRPDVDEAETARRLARSLPPGDTRTFNWAICLRRAAGEEEEDEDYLLGVGGPAAGGELIGIGGVHAFGGCGGGDNGDGGGAFGWPEVGYLFRREYWGLGLGTEFLWGFLGAWEGGALRRGVVERRVEVGSFVSLGGDVVDDDNDDDDDDDDNDNDNDNDNDGDESPPVVELAREQLVAVVDRRNGASRRVLEKCGFESFAEFEEEGGGCGDAEKNVVELVAYRYFPKTACQVSS